MIKNNLLTKILITLGLTFSISTFVSADRTANGVPGDGVLGQVLQSLGGGNSIWTATSTLGISGSLSGGTTGWLSYWTSPTTLSAVATGTAGSFLTASSTSSSGYDWTATSTLATALNYWTKLSNNLYYTGGNVGIGTSTPGYPLTVQSNIYVASSTATNTIGGNRLNLAIGGGATPNAIDIGGSGLVIGQTNADGNIRSGFSSKTFSFLNSSSVAKWRVAYDTGFTGIATTTVDRALTVAGNQYLTGAFFDAFNASGTLGMILQSTGTTTKWFLPEYYDVMNYGASCNGVTDDVNAINAAINAANNAGGGRVMLCRGIHLVSSDRINPKSNVYLQGYGEGATTILGNRSFDYSIYYSSTTSQLTNFRMSDFSLDVNNISNSAGISLNNVTGLKAERMRIYNVPVNGWNFVLGAAGSGATSTIYNTDNTLTDITFDTHTGTLEQLLIYNSSSTNIVRPVFKNNYVGTGEQVAFGLWQWTDNTTITDAKFYGNVDTCFYYSITTNNTKLINPYFYGCPNAIKGANVSDNGKFGETKSHGLQVLNPIIIGASTTGSVVGIQIGATDNVTITNPIIYNMQIGINIGGGNNEATSTSATNWNIINPILYNNNVTANFHTLHPAILISNPSNEKLYGTIMGGQIYDDYLGNQRYPIVLLGNSTTTVFDNLMVKNVRLSAATSTGGVSISLQGGAIVGSSTIIRENQDYTGTNPEQTKINYTDVGNLVSGSILFASSTGSLWQNATNFFWDNTFGRLGLGTSTPSQTLTVAGNQYLTGALFDGSNASGTVGQILQSTGTSTRWVATSSLGISGGSGSSFFATTSINGLATTTFTFATTSDTNISLSIATSSTGLNFISNWIGTLADGRITSASNWNAAFASTTALTPSYIRNLFSNTVTGLTYSAVTGLTSLTAGYVIPLTASTTQYDYLVNSPIWKLANGIVYNATTTDKIGIGTTTPDYRLSVQGSGQLVRIGDGTTNDSSTKLLVENRWTGAGGYGLIVRRNSNTPQLVVDGTGFVGVGTTTPAYSFVNVGATSSFHGIIPETTNTYSLGASTTRWASLWSGIVNVGTSTWSLGQIGTRFGIFPQAELGGTEALTILSDGKVGIGSTSPSSQLTVQGTLNVTGSILQNGSAIGGSSDGVGTSTADYIISKNGSNVVVYDTTTNTNTSYADFDDAMNAIIPTATSTGRSNVVVRSGIYAINSNIIYSGNGTVYNTSLNVTGAGGTSTMLVINTSRGFDFSQRAKVNFKDLGIAFPSGSNTAFYASTTSGVMASVMDSKFSNIIAVSTTTGHTGYVFDFIGDFRNNYDNIRAYQVGNLWRTQNNYSNAQFINGDSNWSGFNFCEINNASAGTCWEVKGNNGQVNQLVFNDINGISNDSGAGSNDIFLKITNGSRITMPSGGNAEQFATTTQIVSGNGIYLTYTKYVTQTAGATGKAFLDTSSTAYNVNVQCKEVELSAATIIWRDKNTLAGQSNRLSGINGGNCIMTDNGGSVVWATSTRSSIEGIYNNIDGSTSLAAWKVLGDKIVSNFSGSMNNFLSDVGSALRIFRGGVERFTFTDSGSLGIGSSTPNYKLSVVGTVGINGLTTSTAGNAICILASNEVVTAGGTTCVTSSSKTKSNITTLKTAKEIMKLRPVSYVNNEGGDTRYGLIAEEAAKVDPILVEYAKSDLRFASSSGSIKKGEPLTVDYQRSLITKMLKFVQDLYTTVQNLSNRTSNVELRLEKLEAENRSLLKRIDELEKTK